VPTLIDHLPHPADLAPAWSAIAATLATRGPRWATSAFARGALWHHDDGGGNWADLVHGDDGRAVLLGHDHEYSETYFREAAAYFGEAETDLLADAPEWWSALAATHLDAIRTEGMWLGFLYAFDGTAWWRADYESDDGFTSLALPFLDRDRAVAAIVDDLTQHCQAESQPVPTDLQTRVDRLVTLCPELTEDVAGHVFAGLTPDIDPTAAVAAARAFRPV
jgi:hypothetical protein